MSQAVIVERNTIVKRALRATERLRSPMAVDTALFAGSSAVASMLSAVSKVLLARVLTVATFGAFSFAVSALQYAAMFFEFGLFLPAGRLAALADGRERRALLGAAVLLFVPVGVAFCATVYGLSFWVDGWFHVHVGEVLRITAPIAWVYPLPFITMQLCQGVGRLYVYSLTTLIAQILFVAALVVAVALGGHPSMALVLTLRGLSLAGGLILLGAWLAPAVAAARRHVRTLLVQAREYGFSVYLGRILSIGTYNMDVLMLAGMTDARTVAVYTLAGAIAAGLGLPVTGLANSLFPRMARADRINRRWLSLSWLGGAAAILAGWICSRIAVGTVFPSTYAPIIGLAIPLALAQAIRGVTGVYNTFLSAHAEGRGLRNAGIVLTASNVTFNFLLIPPFGALGAAWASAIALLANLAAHMFGYRTCVSSVQEATT